MTDSDNSKKVFTVEGRKVTGTIDTTGSKRMMDEIASEETSSQTSTEEDESEDGGGGGEGGEENESEGEEGSIVSPHEGVAMTDLGDKSKELESQAV